MRITRRTHQTTTGESTRRLLWRKRNNNPLFPVLILRRKTMPTHCDTTSCSDSPHLVSASMVGARKVRSIWRGKPWFTLLAGALLMSSAGCARLGLFQSSPPPAPLVQGTRGEIAARVAELEQSLANNDLRGSSRRDAELTLEELRGRLETGDFQVGDQFVITVVQDTVGVDTASVREGLVVSFAALPEVGVNGVLRSELQPRLQAHLDRYVRNASLRVNVLTRIAVLGYVGRPGYYSVSADRPVSEVIMMAGGPTPLTKLDKITVKRDDKELVGTREWNRAVKDGLTLAQLGVQPGDQIEVGGSQPRNWFRVFQIIFFASSAFFALVRLLLFIYPEE